jgi:DNA-binding NtrC family response regulator
MHLQSLNTFIINNDPSTISKIRNHLDRKFGKLLKISTFLTGRTALQNMDANTRIVILDNCLAGESEADVKKSIKLKNPDTEVIMLSSTEEIASAIHNYCELTPDSPARSERNWKRVSRRIQKILSYPIYLLVREFGVSKFVAIFLMAWLTIGVVVAISLAIWFKQT